MAVVIPVNWWVIRSKARPWKADISNSGNHYWGILQRWGVCWRPYTEVVALASKYIGLVLILKTRWNLSIGQWTLWSNSKTMDFWPKILVQILASTCFSCRILDKKLKSLLSVLREKIIFFFWKRLAKKYLKNPCSHN